MIDRGNKVPYFEVGDTSGMSWINPVTRKKILAYRARNCSWMKMGKNVRVVYLLVVTEFRVEMTVLFLIESLMVKLRSPRLTISWRGGLQGLAFIWN